MSLASVQNYITRARSVLTEVPGDMTGTDEGDAIQNVAAALAAATDGLSDLLRETQSLEQRVRKLETA